MMAVPLLAYPTTLPFLLAVVVFVFTALKMGNNEGWHELDDMYIEDISGFDSSRYAQDEHNAD